MGAVLKARRDPQRSKSVWGEALCSGRASTGALEQLPIPGHSVSAAQHQDSGEGRGRGWTALFG